jgi:hypothetical protein
MSGPLGRGNVGRALRALPGLKCETRASRRWATSASSGRIRKEFI